MPAEFPDFDAPSMPRQRVRPPIDYRSRNTKLRLFTAVAGVIVVLAMAERARDPASWNWLFGLKGKTEEAEKPIDNHVARKEATSHEPETVFRNHDDKKVLPEKGKGEESVPAQHSWKAAWQSVWRDLGSDERTLLFRLVETAADNTHFSTESATRAENAIAAVDGLWGTYQASAFQEIAAMKAEEQKTWTETLRHVNARWTKELKPALQLIALGGNASEAERKTLADFQKDIEQICLTQVHDDTVFLRPDENQIWFHLFHELQTKSPEELSKLSEGVVGYSAIFNQPEAYRGKVVTVRAQVRRAYSVPAIKNYLGVKEFIIMYLAPEGVPDKSVVVYSLGLPKGFPKLDPKSHPSGMTLLHEDVTLTGYFFKRGAYRGTDSNYTAPLILVNVPTWQPPQGEQDTFARGRAVWKESVIVSVVLFVVASIVVFVVVRSNRSPGRKLDDEKTRAAVADLKNADLPPTLQESLKRLAEEGPDDAK
jgi:hypothetical protein